MRKKKNLNGIPGNLAQTFFGSWMNQGQNAGWLYYVANETGITNIEIEILGNTVRPKEVDIKQLHSNLYHLEKIIETQLINFGFEKDFIIKAVLQFEINLNSKIVYCNSFIEDQENNIYKSKKTLYENAYPFDDFFIKGFKKDNRNILKRLTDFFK